ncbi:MAG: hypothetical protein ACREDR_32735, partial [Blastocatellia bacterium]
QPGQGGRAPQIHPGSGQIIYVLGADGKLQPLYVRVGITNGRVTEVSGKEAAEGQVIVIGQNDVTQSQGANPLTGRRGVGR